ncbi:MAG: hypothetical protein ACI9HK_000489 [Pirellulaceae bacterium]|jgi:hypothetical protein
MGKTALIFGILCSCVPLTSVYAKRSAPKDVASVSHAGVRYQVVHYKADNGQQNGGYVEAISGQDGKKLWSTLIYLIEYDLDLETDVQDCFITSLQLDEGKSQLQVKNEVEGLYYVDLKTRKVMHVLRR